MVVIIGRWMVSMLKKIRSLFVVVPLTFVFMNTVFAGSLDFGKLTIFHTNDTHGFDEYNEKDGNMGCNETIWFVK